MLEVEDRLPAAAAAHCHGRSQEAEDLSQIAKVRRFPYGLKQLV